MPATDVFAPDSVALITGGASGIGFAIAKLCRSKGMKVLLVDRKADDLERAKAELSGGNLAEESVIAFPSDVSELDQWTKLKDKAIETFGSVELMVLNAGTGVKGSWGSHDYFYAVLQTNLFGVIHGINTFLPVVQEAAKSKPTAIIITGSKQGVTNPPGNPAYNASKAAVKALAEHLSWDLKEETTSVHLLVPGWTFTAMTGGGNLKVKPAGAWTAEQVAAYMHRKMGENKFYIICPDNDVSEETDKKRMLWSVGDMVNERPALSRWREEWKKEADDTMAKTLL